MATQCNSVIISNISKGNFQGCLIGALIGDCLGSPFECRYWSEKGIRKDTIFQKLKLRKADGAITDGKKHFKYTDDSTMTKSIASSLLTCKSFNSLDMASQFSQRFFKERFRGYGQEITKIFYQWHENEITKENVFKPSNSQFNGSGSYGNGGAMRVSPVGLFAGSVEECIKVARQTAQLTHSNKHGYNGAILQTLAVYKVLNRDKNDQFEATTYINELKTEISKLEDHPSTSKRSCDLEEYIESEEFTFTHQLDVITDLMKLNEHNTYEESVENAICKLGRGVTAMEAVPAALYSFLHNVHKGFQETMYFAISLGGDTDTIASMACAIAGAYHGLENIPSSWILSCEDSKEFLKYGEQFYDLRKKEAKNET